MIDVQHITKTYQNGDSLLYAINDASFQVQDGDFVVILGPSGSGKSTLLNSLSGLESVNSGSISYDGRDITKLDKKALTALRRVETAFIFQAYYLLPTLSVEANIKMGADLADIRDVSGIIAAVGLAGKEKRLPHELSGGEQQRVSIARALSKRPKVLFCDEPTGALDEETGRQIMRHLLRLHKEEQLTVIMVTHNAHFADVATKVITMNSGKITGVQTRDCPSSLDEVEW